MPTTQPLDYGDEAEGQLKPIAQFTQQPSAQQSAAPAASPALVQSATKPPTATQTSATQAPAMHTLSHNNAASTPGIQRRSALRNPGLSIHSVPATQQPTEQHAEPTPANKLATPFTLDQLIKAWLSFTETIPSEHLLVNTMRMSLPQSTQPAPQGAPLTSAVLTVEVDNPIQVAQLRGRMPEIIDYLNTTLANNQIQISVKAKEGPADPATWTQREVLEHMLKESPALKDFIHVLALKQ